MRTNLLDSQSVESSTIDTNTFIENHSDEKNTQSTKKILNRRPEISGKKELKHALQKAKIWRRIIQTIFVLVNAYIAVTFYFWVRYYETFGETLYMPRPAGVEAWLPIAGMLNLKYAIVNGSMPYIHAAAMLLLATFLIISAIFKKSFCSWICPIGTLSEFLYLSGKRVFGRNWFLPIWLDIPLRGLKYLLLAFFIWIVASMSASAIEMFMYSPYSVIADVKMMNFFRYASTATLVSVFVLVIGSIFIPNLWCRYLCPYGALVGLLSIFSPYKIRRDAQACIDCAKCAKVCPARLPVDVKKQIRSPECTACMSCIDVCPAKNALQLSLPPASKEASNRDIKGINQRWRWRKIHAGILACCLLILISSIIILAKRNDWWENPFTESMYQRIIPKAQEFGHY